MRRKYHIASVIGLVLGLLYMDDLKTNRNLRHRLEQQRQEIERLGKLLSQKNIALETAKALGFLNGEVGQLALRYAMAGGVMPGPDPCNPLQTVDDVAVALHMVYGQYIRADNSAYFTERAKEWDDVREKFNKLFPGHEEALIEVYQPCDQPQSN